MSEQEQILIFRSQALHDGKWKGDPFLYSPQEGFFSSPLQYIKQQSLVGTGLTLFGMTHESKKNAHL